MSKEKFYKVGFILLLLINVGVISFLFFAKPSHRKKDSLKSKVTSILNFEEAQITQYENLIKAHQSKVKQEEEKLISFKKALYVSTTKENIDEKYLDSIANSVRRLEAIHTQHFLDIKQICTNEQLKEFEKLSKEFSKHFDKPKMKKKKHDK